MRKQWSVVAGVVALVSALAVPAHAQSTLTSVDYAAVGDGLLTYDSASGLSWLDLTETRGLFGPDILAGQGGWVQNGFRYATPEEIDALFAAANLGPPLEVFVVDHYAPVLAFMQLFGATRYREPNGEWFYSETAGLYRNSPASIYPDAVGLADVAVLESATEAGRGFVQNRHTAYGGFLGSQYPGIGHYLVRESAPDAGLLLAGLISDVVAMNLKAGIANSFDHKLKAVVAALDEQNDAGVVKALSSFIKAVETQRGKKLTDTQADQLVASATSIIAVIGG